METLSPKMSVRPRVIENHEVAGRHVFIRGSSAKGKSSGGSKWQTISRAVDCGSAIASTTGVGPRRFSEDHDVTGRQLYVRMGNMDEKTFRSGHLERLSSLDERTFRSGDLERLTTLHQESIGTPINGHGTRNGHNNGQCPDPQGSPDAPSASSSPSASGARHGDSTSGNIDPGTSVAPSMFATVGGESQNCPTCRKPVYFAEEKFAFGKKFHKLCFKCAGCTKQLDSANSTEHAEEVFCKTCYGKKYGPSGYGYGVGSGVLSSDKKSECPPTIDSNAYKEIAALPAGPPKAIDYNSLPPSPALPRKSVPNAYKEIAALPAGPPKAIHYNSLPPSPRLPKKSVQEAVYLDLSAVPINRPSSSSEFKPPSVCAECRQPVYHAEEKLAFGRKWHKNCFKCGSCSKILEASFLEHASKPSCKTCHAKMTAPARDENAPVVASGKSKDTMKKCLAEMRAAPTGGGDVCLRCCKSVYAAELCKASDKVFHRLCFNCCNCHKKLEVGSHCDKDDEVFCKTCYGRLFGPKGVNLVLPWELEKIH